MISKRDPILRRLTPLDAAAAFQLSTEAGWNQTESDWHKLIEFAAEGCIGIEIEGELASTATLVCYEKRLAWIGMVLTKRHHQGHGFAKRLLTELLRLADLWSISTVKLDATADGQRIYEQLGFRGEQIVERWEYIAAAASPGGQVAHSSLSQELLDLDELAFGVDRSLLLRNLFERGDSLVSSDGYLLSRPGRVRAVLGPCVATTPETARALIGHVLSSTSSSGWYWDLLSSNKNAVALTHGFGFAPKRQLLRMVRGNDLRTRDENVYALAGFEFG